jgi:hypothetical protein
MFLRFVLTISSSPRLRSSIIYDENNDVDEEDEVRKKSREKTTKNFNHRTCFTFWTAPARITGSNPVEIGMHVLVFSACFPSRVTKCIKTSAYRN